jgi:hypothetical protein
MSTGLKCCQPRQQYGQWSTCTVHLVARLPCSMHPHFARIKGFNIDFSSSPRGIIQEYDFRSVWFLREERVCTCCYRGAREHMCGRKRGQEKAEEQAARWPLQGEDVRLDEVAMFCPPCTFSAAECPAPQSSLVAQMGPTSRWRGQLQRRAYGTTL